MKSVNTFNFLPEKNWEHLVGNVETEWWVVTSHLLKLNEIPILTWDVMCHLTLSTRNTNTKTPPKLATTTRLTRRLFLNNKNERFSGKNSCGTTWLHFLLCYGHFCVIWPFCSLQNMGQCFHLDFFQIFTYFLFFNFRYQLIPHQKNTPALT